MSNSTPPPPPPPPNNPQQPGGQSPFYGGTPQPPAHGAPAPWTYEQTQQPAYGGPPAYYAPAPVAKPQAVKTAQILMYVGAAAAIFNIVIVLIFRDQLTEQIRNSSGAEFSDSELNALVNVGIAAGIFGGLVGVGLWLLMAWANGKGYQWARITASVFFAINVFSTLYALVTPGLAISKIVGVAVLVFGGIIIYLLWRGKGSNEYFKAPN